MSTPTPDPITEAQRLGTEHGTRDAQTLIRRYLDERGVSLTDAVTLTSERRPVPDLTDAYTPGTGLFDVLALPQRPAWDEQHGEDDDEGYDAMLQAHWHAYETAYLAAVAATIEEPTR